MRTNPVLERVIVGSDGNLYNLTFDLVALAEAEESFTLQGHDAKLRMAWGEAWSSVEIWRSIFACALHKFHPELSFEEARQLATFPALCTLCLGIRTAWAAATMEARAVFAHRTVANGFPQLAGGPHRVEAPCPKA
jgi:hypothetical protein